MSISLFEIKSMSFFDFLLIMISTSLEGVKAWAIEHLLLDLAAVRAPGHQKDLRLERGLGPIRVELVIVIVDTISAVIRVSILLMQVVQKVLVAVVAVAHLWREAVFIKDISGKIGIASKTHRLNLNHPSLDDKGGIPVLLALLDLLVGNEKVTLLLYFWYNSGNHSGWPHRTHAFFIQILRLS